MSGHPSEQVDELRRWYVDHVFSGVTDFDTIVAFDPSTGATLATVPVCSPAVVNAATTRARAAQGPWSRTSGQERGRLMTACADRLAEIGDELALLLALESGKALETESRGEVILVEEIFRYFGGVSHELKGHTTPLGTDVMGFTTRHPHGVVAGIVPWNVPLMFMGYKVAAPLVAGNTAVIKVPEQTSFTLIRVLQELVAILPADVVQFLTGTGDTTGAALVADPHVDTVSFTGSVETGRSVYEAAAKLIRPVTLELGGKSPMIILSDCDIDKAVSGVVKSMRFTRGGQSCTAASRVFVAASMIDEFRVRLAAALDEIVIGVALDPNTHCGPLVSARQRDRVQAYIDTATADGLTVETYGTVADGVDWDGGYYVRPCVVIDPPADHPIAVEEVFGPVVCLFTYDDLDDALDRANDTEYGLSASVWGRDLADCMRLADSLEAGIVQINQNAIMVPGISYGGIRNSGLGREGSLEAMLDSYTYAKTNIVNYSD